MLPHSATGYFLQEINSGLMQFFGLFFLCVMLVARLRRAIAYANGGRFRVRSQNEQEIWNECARLIANAVVHYNAMLLSEMVKVFEKQRDSESLKNLERISPQAWQHINFYGRYQFDREIEPLNLAAMANQIMNSGALPWRKQV